jgi:hypothetical protein
MWMVHIATEERAMLRSRLVLATAALALACLASTDGFARGSFVQANKLVIALQPPPAPRRAPPQRPPSGFNINKGGYSIAYCAPCRMH